MRNAESETAAVTVDLHLGAQERLEQIIGDIRTLVEVQSPSSDVGAVATSAEAVSALGERLLGVAAERLDVDGVAHLRWRLGEGPPRVLLLCHHDTVWPIGSWGSAPVCSQKLTTPSGNVEGEEALFGPGVFDMKGGLVQALHAVSLLAQQGTALDGVSILVTGDEETGSISSRALIESEAALCKAVLVLEASAPGGALKTSRKGVGSYRLDVHGLAAHAGLEPENGINAGVELAHQVLAVASLSGAGTTVTPTVMTAGTTMNTVPAKGSLTIDVRAWTAAELERVDVGLRSLAAVLPGAVLELHGGINRPPLEESSSASLYERARTVAHKLGLPELACVAVGGASDGNITAGLGVPTLDGLGAVGGGAHAVGEHALTAPIAGRTALLAALIESLLCGEEP